MFPSRLGFVFALLPFVWLLCIHQVFAVDWSRISDPNQLAAIPANLFWNLTSEDAGNIPAKACPGFQDEQVRIIPSNAFAGFTSNCMTLFNISTASVVSADQLSNLDSGFSAGCSGLSANWVMNLTFSALESWQQKCVARTSSMWSEISAEFLNWAPENVIRSLGSAQVKNIAPSTFAQLSKSQIALLSNEGCAGISTDMFTAIPAETFGGFTWRCISGIQTYLWSRVTFDQFSSLADSSLAGLPAHGLQQLSDDGYRAISPEQLSSLLEYLTSCSSMKPSGPALMPVDTWKSISYHCTTTMPSMAFISLDASRIAVFPDSVCAELSASQLGYLNAKYVYALTDTCIGQFSTSCSGFHRDLLAGLRAESFSALTGECVQATRSLAWGGISAEQLHDLSLEGCANLGATAGSIPSTAFQNLTSTCLAAFDSSSCEYLAPRSITYFDPSFFGILKIECLNAFSSALISQISPAQATLIPPAVSSAWNDIYLLSQDATSALRTEQVESLPQNVITKFGPHQISALIIQNGQPLVRAWGLTPLSFPLYVIEEFKKNVKSHTSLYSHAFFEFPSSDVFSRVSWLRLFFSNATASSYNLRLWQSMPPLAFAGIPSWHTELISTSIWANTSEAAAAKLLPDTVSTMTAQQFIALSPAAIGSLKVSTWAAVSADAIALLSPSQVAMMDPIAFSVMFCYQLEAFSSAQLMNATEEIRGNLTIYSRPCPHMPPQGTAEPPQNQQNVVPSGPSNDTLKIALIVVSAVLAVTIIGCVIVWVVSRRNRGIAYVPLE